MDLDVLRRTIFWESKRRFQCAGHTAASKSLRSGKKDIVHSFRYMLLAMQIVKEVLLWCVVVGVVTCEANAVFLLRGE